MNNKDDRVQFSYYMVGSESGFYLEANDEKVHTISIVMKKMKYSGKKVITICVDKNYSCTGMITKDATSTSIPITSLGVEVVIYCINPDKKIYAIAVI